MHIKNNLKKRLFNITKSLNELNYNKPISGLINNFTEINMNIPNFKLIYFNNKEILKILYDKEKTFILDYSFLKSINLSNSFYLSLLINYNENIISYEYSFDFIKKINDQLNSKYNNIFENIINSKLIIDLIENYRQLDNYDEEKEEEELRKIENDNITKFKNNINEIKKLDLIIDEKIIKEKK